MNNYQRFISKIHSIGWEEINDIVDCRIQHGELYTDLSNDLTKEDIKYYGASKLEKVDKSIRRVK